jgi:erythromycin esterase-like protein
VVRNSATLASKAKPLERALLERIHSQAQFVLIGEASHGTGACACRPAACTLIWARL